MATSHRGWAARRACRGYTLLEMVIVLSIIGLLLGMAIYGFLPILNSTKVQKVEADLLAFKEGLAAYQLDTDSLPTTEQGLQVLWSRPTIEPIPARWHAVMEQEIKDPWNNSYQYRNPGTHNPSRYDIFSMGPDGKPDTEDDIGNWTSGSTTP